MVYRTNVINFANAFKDTSYATSGGWAMGSGSAFRGSTLEFDASDSNSIYGNSTTVTPKSYTIIFLIKY